jgi:hypothetical protein
MTIRPADVGFSPPAPPTPAQQIRIHCLQNLLAVTQRMQIDYADAIANFETQHNLTEEAYTAFIEDFSAEHAMDLLQATLELTRCFAAIQPLCQQIDRVQALVDNNLQTLQALPNYERIDALIGRLVNAREHFNGCLPTGSLQELRNYVSQDSDLTDEFNNSLADASEEVQHWWNLWNTENPDFGAALEYAGAEQPARGMQLDN